MKKVAKQIIVLCSSILLVLGITALGMISKADVISPTPALQSTSSPENSKSNTELSSGENISTKVDSQKFALDNNEGLDSWMPNSDLQELVASKLGVDKSQITKDLLANSQLKVSYEFDKEFFYLPSYEGLQFFSSISADVSASSEDSSLVYLRAHPIQWENLRDMTNLTITVDGDLTAIFPNGIELDDNRINIDPHNIYFLNEVNLNQNNFKSFFLNYSDLKLLNVDPSIFNYISDLSFGEGGYKVTPQPNGLQFELTSDIDYSLLAGNSYVNTNKYPNFPDGPYIQLLTGTKYINSRINLHYNLLGADVTVKYVDVDNNVISDKVIKSGNIGENYTTEQKTIDGYTFKEVQGDATGKFTDQPQTITYVYTKNLLVGANVTVKYVDIEGNVISDSVIKSGNVGGNYITEQKTIDGYTFKEVQGSATGKFTDQPQTITYVYTKNRVPVLSPTSSFNAQSEPSKEVIKTLPQTGENSPTSFIALILGSLLLGVGAIFSVFRIKKSR